jgi:cellulose synthase/poly-beta-1,6-N-acetylglucosamine synthase-like glycosyltransferase
MHLLWIISFCLLLLYILKILSFRLGLYRAFRIKTGQVITPGVSIVLPVRNEDGNIGQLLEDLTGQDYPADHLEIIIVDDHSDDRTPEIIESFCNRYPHFRYLSLGPSESGKKAALYKGIGAAKHPLIINTDGDCRVQGDWVAEMVRPFSDPAVRMVIGAVVLDPDRGVFRSMQSLEFFSLTAVSAGSAGLKNPVLCNGANLAYYRENYLRFHEETELHSESGDDIFLMLWLKKKFPGSIRFSVPRNSVIRTLPSPGLSSYIMQRIRWSSKSRYYRDTGIIFTSLPVYALNALLMGILLAFLIIFFLTGIWNPGLIQIFGIILVVKTIVDLVLLAPVLRYYRKTRLLLYFLPLQMIYFVYVSLVGLVGQFSYFTWKGRKISIVKQKQVFGSRK